MRFSRKQMVELASKFYGTTKGSDNHKKLIKVFNTFSTSSKEIAVTDEWRAVTASSLLIMGEFDEKTAPISSNIAELINKAKTLKIWNTSKAQAGDLVVYKWPEDTDSVGLVLQKDGDIVEVLVGDMGKTELCGKVFLDLKRDYIIGVVSVRYDDKKADKK